MYQTWEIIKAQYPNRWIVMSNVRYADKFHMELLGGEIEFTAHDQDELFSNMPEDDMGDWAVRHTNEGEAHGIFIYGI
jgi:hypothetical protein